MILFGCRHDWTPWSELEFAGAEYELIVGPAYYTQRRRCLKCHRIGIRTQRVTGAGRDLRAQENSREGDPLWK